MTDTVISSATKEVVIGFDRPFVIIGERINPTGRKIMAAEMLAGDYSRVIADALAQVEEGRRQRRLYIRDPRRQPRADRLQLRVLVAHQKQPLRSPAQGHNAPYFTRSRV